MSALQSHREMPFCDPDIVDVTVIVVALSSLVQSPQPHYAVTATEFWMPVSEMCFRFQTLDMCDLSTEGRDERLEALRALIAAPSTISQTAAEIVGCGGQKAKQIISSRQREDNCIADRSIGELLELIEGPSNRGKEQKKKQSKQK